jgi:hypothetical protein
VISASSLPDKSKGHRTHQRSVALVQRQGGFNLMPIPRIVDFGHLAFEAIRAVQDTLIIPGAGVQELLVRRARVFSRRSHSLQLIDQFFNRVWEANGKVVGLERRFQRLNGQGITTVAQREDRGVSNIERGLI